jgi:uncharacterized membrane protein
MKDCDDPGKARRHATVLHDSFEIGILLKGIHAALELVGAYLLWFFKPDAISRLVRLLTQHELSRDPDDLLANWIIQASARFSVGARSFAVFYLLSHGLIKLVIVLLLWRRKLWAYPMGVGVLVLFIAYQAARWTTTHSVFLILLSVFDAAMIWLTIVEYRRLKTDPWQRGNCK